MVEANVMSNRKSGMKTIDRASEYQNDEYNQAAYSDSDSVFEEIKIDEDDDNDFVKGAAS